MQNTLPIRPEAREGWTFRPLIALRSAIATIAKTFNAMETVLFFQIVVTGIGELFGRFFSVYWYIGVAIVLVVCSFERRAKVLIEEEKVVERANKSHDV